MPHSPPDWQPPARLHREGPTLLWIFLGRTVKAPQVRKVIRGSRIKTVHLVHLRHRDEVEAPVTDWLREAYDVSDRLSAKSRGAKTKKKTSKKTPKKKRRAQART